MKRFILVLITVLLGFSAFAQTENNRDQASYKNLTIFLISGKDQLNRSYLTLEEALAQGDVILRETGRVNQLSADNKSNKHPYQAFARIGLLCKLRR